MEDYPGTFQMIDPRLLIIDPRYQRGKKQNLITQIARDPSWAAFGTAIAFKRDNDMYYLADGQQRVQGMMLAVDPPKEVPIIWFPMEKVEDEAEIFVKINEWRKQLMPMEKYKSQVQAKDPAALAVQRAVEQAGFSIGMARGGRGEDPKTIQAIGSINRIYNQLGEEGVLRTLTVIKSAWPDDAVGLSVHILRGVANLIEEQGDDYDRPKLVRALSRSTPAHIVRKADELKYMHGGSKIYNMRKAIKALCKI